MENTKKNIFISIVMAVVLIISSVIVVPVQQETYAASKVKLSDTKKTMHKGSAYTLKVTGGKASSFKSSNKKVASVTKKGKITAKKKGKATITVKVGKKSLKCKVTVVNKHSHKWEQVAAKTHKENVTRKIKTVYYYCGTGCGYKCTGQAILAMHFKECPLIEETPNASHIMISEWVDVTNTETIIDSPAGKKCSVCGKFVAKNVGKLPSSKTICSSTTLHCDDLIQNSNYITDLQSSNLKVAMIRTTKNGEPYIKAIGVGTTTITANVNGTTQTMKLTVKDHDWHNLNDGKAFEIDGVYYWRQCDRCGAMD